MSVVPTFRKKLGRVSFVYQGQTYEARIADSTVIVDDRHNKVLDDALAWIHFIKKTYGPPPTAVQVPTRTLHELCRHKASSAEPFVFFNTTTRPPKFPAAPMAPASPIHPSSSVASPSSLSVSPPPDHERDTRSTSSLYLGWVDVSPAKDDDDIDWESTYPWGLRAHPEQDRLLAQYGF